MKNRVIYKLISISGAMLISFLLGYLVSVNNAGNILLNQVIAVLMAVIAITGTVFLVKTVLSKDFKSYLDSVDKYVKDEENQLTKKQIVLFDLIMFLFGLVLLFAKYITFRFSGYGFAAVLKDVVVYTSLAYFAVLIVAVFYTYMFIKENKENKENDSQREDQ